MVKDVFGMSHVKLTGTDGSPIYLLAVDIKGLIGTDYGCELFVVSGGCHKDVFCKESPEEVVAIINDLADKQDKQHKELEAEAKAEAQERFFDKFPKAKAAYLAEVEEQKKQNNKQ